MANSSNSSCPPSYESEGMSSSKYASIMSFLDEESNKANKLPTPVSSFHESEARKKISAPASKITSVSDRRSISDNFLKSDGSIGKSSPIRSSEFSGTKSNSKYIWDQLDVEKEISTSRLVPGSYFSAVPSPSILDTNDPTFSLHEDSTTSSLTSATGKVPLSQLIREVAGKVSRLQV